jgi:hypothetical protein
MKASASTTATKMILTTKVSVLDNAKGHELMQSVVSQIVLSQKQGMELIKVNPTLFSPSFWDGRQENMNREVSSTAERRNSHHGRPEGDNVSKSAWTDDLILETVEITLD